MGGEGGIAGRAEGGLELLAGAEGEELAEGGLGRRDYECKLSLSCHSNLVFQI